MNTTDQQPSRRDWIGLAVLSVGLGLIVLDGTIVGVALPSIIHGLGLNLTDAQWVNSLYAVILAGLLISSRAVQAVGAALIMPSTLSTVNAVFRGKSRVAAFGVWGAVISGAAAVGPLAGGALTQWVSFQKPEAARSFQEWMSMVPY